MRTRSHVNHARVSRDRAVLAFDPIASGIPPVRIIDRECEDFDAVARGYSTLVQSIRMVSCDRRNVWAPSDRRFSAAAIGLDGKGHVLLMHTRVASDVHALVETLLALPLDLRRAMYVEGGPEAQLVVRAGGGRSSASARPPVSSTPAAARPCRCLTSLRWFGGRGRGARLDYGRRGDHRGLELNRQWFPAGWGCGEPQGAFVGRRTDRRTPRKPRAGRRAFI